MQNPPPSDERVKQLLVEAREHIDMLREEVERLSSTPNTYGTVLGYNEDDPGTVDVVINGTRFRVEAPHKALVPGEDVLINEVSAIISAQTPYELGQVFLVKEILDEGERVVVKTDGSEVLVVSNPRNADMREGDQVRLDSSSSMVIERLPRNDMDSLRLEETPDIRYADIGGLSKQVGQIRDAVELPVLQSEKFKHYGLRAPRGVLLSGPPGVGKTLIAKAVANSLAEQEGTEALFLSVKGPELLSKWVGETESQIRQTFKRARDAANQGRPVIIFFDELESMFRTRGSGVSSDIESTIVPQMLAEMDGLEELSNVLVIGATNRADLVDPALLRPGRLDVKIQINRPDREGAEEIFDIYVPEDAPYLAEGHRAIVSAALDEMYREDKENEFIELTYERGDREILYFKDFASGAVIENVIRRAKREAIKREVAGGKSGLTSADVVTAVREEFAETEDLPNVSSPDDWAKISGKKGERIVHVRVLREPTEERVVETSGVGNYL